MSKRNSLNRSGVKQYSIARWENGHNVPKPEALANVARALEVAFDDLYGIIRTNSVTTEKLKEGIGAKRGMQIQRMFRRV